MEFNTKGVSKMGLLKLFAHYGKKRSGIRQIARMLQTDERTVIQAAVDAGIFKRERFNFKLNELPEKHPHPCDGCVWGKCIDKGRYYCISPACLKGGKVK